MKYLFSRTQRLTKSSQFKEVLKKGKRITTKVCVIYYCETNLTYPRLGVIVAKKNIRKAYARNFFKRVVREGFRLRQHKLPNVDIVFLAYKQDGEQKQLWHYLAKQWQKLIQHQETV